MRKQPFILFGFILTLVLLLTQCNKEQVDSNDYNEFIEINPLGSGSDRLVAMNEQVPLRAVKHSTSGDLTFTLKYILEGPVVDGFNVQASHIQLNEWRLYLAYNTAGDDIRGGFEVVDFTDPSNPLLHAYGTVDKEYSSLDIFTDQNTGQRKLMLAGAAAPEQGSMMALLQVLNLDANGLPLLTPETQVLQGYVATDVNHLGLVSGTNGAFYTIYPTSPSQVIFGTDLDDARSVAYNQDNGEYVILLGQPGRLLTGLPGSPNTIFLGGNTNPGAKSIVRTVNGYAFAAVGDGGLQVIDLENEMVTGVLPAPEARPGYNTEEFVTNGVSVNEAGYVFIANGAAGVYVAKLTEAGSLELLGYLDLNSSVNYVEAYADYLFVASGARGVAIIRIEGMPVTLPTVSTHTVDQDHISPYSALVGGTVVGEGGQTVVSRGICWDTHPEPEVSDHHIQIGSGLGSFSYTLQSLNPATQYYVRAYAVNESGMAYGNEITFVTPDEGNGHDWIMFVDPRDNKAYKTIVIGSQTWLAENLAWLPSVSPPSSGSLIDPYYYVYDYNGFDVSQAKEHQSYAKYGVLYNWIAALDACPDGWHLPTDLEWMTLEQYLGMESGDLDKTRFRLSGSVGEKLKSSSTWSEDGGGDGSSFFEARASGYRERGGPFKYAGLFTAYWSADKIDDRPVYRGLYYFNPGIYRSTWNMSGGFSIRCVKN